MDQLLASVCWRDGILSGRTKQRGGLDEAGCGVCLWSGKPRAVARQECSTGVLREGRERLCPTRLESEAEGRVWRLRHHTAEFGHLKVSLTGAWVKDLVKIHSLYLNDFKTDWSHFMANRWGNNGNSERLFFWAPKSLQMVTAAMKLKDTYSLEGKLWPT